MRRDYEDSRVVKFLCDQMGEQEPFGLQWEESSDGGLETVVNGVVINLWGSDTSPILLRLGMSRGKEHTIREPGLPKESVRRGLARISPRLALWFSSSKATEEANNKSELRKLLETLLIRVHKQAFANRVNYEERQARIKEEIFNQLTGKTS